MMKLYSLFILLFFTSTLFAQTNWNFSTPASLSGSPWQSTANITIGGVPDVIFGGINGSFTNASSGGNGNSPALKKDASGGDNVTIKRVDGKRFQFYNLWLNQSSMYPYLAFTEVKSCNRRNFLILMLKEIVSFRIS